MEFEFDKEMDSILRQTAQRENIVSTKFNAHIDADEISLFAENALMKKARLHVTEHLADCSKCRKILSNVIALNSESPSEIVHTEESKVTVVYTPIPWYRKLFAFPQLAYTMGGLTVLLAGMIGFIALQSFNESKNSSIAQLEKTSERPRGASGADSDGETVTMETYSANTSANAASVASNAPANASNAAMNVAGKSNIPNTPAVSNSNTAASIPLKRELSPVELAATPSPATETEDAAKNEKDSENKEAKPETNYSADSAAGSAARQRNDYPQNSIVQNQTAITPDSRNVQTRRVQNLPMNNRSAPVSIQQEPSSVPRDAAKTKSVDDKKLSSEKPRSIGGKKFTRKDGVWYDTAYNQQKTVNVRRNSGDYKKLDSGLRLIADNLGGTVVIVWKSSAYRIQ